MPHRQAARHGRSGSDGYDDSQRDQILMATQDAPSDGLLQTWIVPDLEDEGDDRDDIESYGAEMPEIREDRRGSA